MRSVALDYKSLKDFCNLEIMPEKRPFLRSIIKVE
jgi:hypothetical protein